MLRFTSMFIVMLKSGGVCVGLVTSTSTSRFCPPSARVFSSWARMKPVSIMICKKVCQCL